jgi:hypothetical protein
MFRLVSDVRISLSCIFYVDMLTVGIAKVGQRTSHRLQPQLKRQAHEMVISAILFLAKLGDKCFSCSGRSLGTRVAKFFLARNKKYKTINDNLL